MGFCPGFLKDGHPEFISIELAKDWLIHWVDRQPVVNNDFPELSIDSQ